MKSFACGAAAPHCVATFTAETEPEIFGLVDTHARDDHGMDTVPPELVDQVRGHITTV